MSNILKSTVVTAGLAIFSMLFGAGNLMYPIKAGLNSGDKIVVGIFGFLLTAVLIPVIGLVGIIFFNGDYKRFFYRLGKAPGNFIIAFSMATIGPLYAMSRIVTVCYEMLKPFLPDVMTAGIFSILFCGLTFLATYKESKVIDLLGHLISPALLISLSVVLIKGILGAHQLKIANTDSWTVFSDQAILGYEHLDLLGTIFFGSIVLSILKTNLKGQSEYNQKNLAWIGMKAGLVGCFLLGVVYTGMALLGAYYGAGLESHNVAELFSLVSFKILGQNGALIIATAVAMACFSTIIALSAVLSEYIQHDLANNKISYIKALTLTLGSTILVSLSGIEALLKYAKPVIITIYPLFITLTLCNLAYSLWGFKWVKSPVLATLLFSIWLNWASYSVYCF
jgi:LIVCS family branched-chain amino acid:cation transporter